MLGDHESGRRAKRFSGMQLLGYIWAAPNTLLAIAIGLLLNSRFRVVDGVVEIHGRGIAFFLTRFPVSAAAMTLGHAVFGCDQTALRRTRKHERVHVRQYARWGIFFVPSYLLCSAVLLLLGRDAYRENPFEVEAYAAEEGD